MVVASAGLAFLAVQSEKADIRCPADLDDVFAYPASVSLGNQLRDIGSLLLYGIPEILLLTLEKLGGIVIASGIAAVQIN